MNNTISQRELRNDSGGIMRALTEGETFTITRNGQPVGELSPLRRHRFVPAEAAIELFQNAAPVDYAQLRHDLEQILAELAAGPHATNDPAERSRRQDRLQRAEAAFDPLPFDADAARAYGRVFSAVYNAGRKPRRARAVDLLIAATALATSLPIYTRNPADFQALDDLIEVITV